MIPKATFEHTNQPRSAFLAAAQAAFLELGYDRASMTEVSQRVAGAPDVVWTVFTSKEEIFVEMVDAATQGLQALLLDLLKPGRDVRSTLTRFSAQFLGLLVVPERLALHRLICAEAKRFPRAAELFYSRGAQALHERVSEYLQACVAEGLLEDVSTLEMAQVLTRLALGDLHAQAMFLGMATSIDDIHHQAVLAADHFLRIFARPVSALDGETP